MGHDDITVVVIGALNTDIVAQGVDGILKPGELTRSGRLMIGPGGKSRNMAQMLAAFMGPGRVAMIGRTARDRYNLWRVPLDALNVAGVDTSFVKVLDNGDGGEFPGVALIPVDAKGENQIYCVPGASGSFCPDDIDAAAPLFESAARNGGMLLMSLEQPLETALFAVTRARALGLRVMLDPGGIDARTDYAGLPGKEIYFLKPNEHEAKILTGVEVRDMKSARAAAGMLLSRGIGNVLVTLGEKGAALFNKESELAIPAPVLPASGERDATGCGDQVTAVLCAGVVGGADIAASARRAVLAGTMQYQRRGIRPVTKDELDAMKGGAPHE